MATERDVPHPTPPTPTTPHPPTPAPLPSTPIKKAKTDGPDAQTAQPVPGAPTVPTSLGELDRDTVMHNRVGGVGVVHMHADPSEDTPGGAPPVGGGSATRGSEGAGDRHTTDTKTTEKIGK